MLDLRLWIVNCGFWIVDCGLDRFGLGDLDKDNLKKIDVE